MADGVVRYVGYDFVAEALVERARLEAEGGQEDAAATLESGLVFRLLQELPAVAPSAERLGDPEQGEVQPSPQTCPDAPPRIASRSSLRKIASGL